MANQQPDLSNESIQRAEHIDPATTGDNIAAKKVANYVWDGVSAWARMTQPSSGGGAVTVADGADVTLGSKTDAKSTATDTTAITIMQVLKEISFMEQNPASRAVTNTGTFAVQAAVSNLPTTVDTNSGNKSASTLRVVLATDQPQLTNKLLVTPDANSSVNLGQVGGGNTATGHGVASGSLRVELPTDGTGVVGLNAGSNKVGTVSTVPATSGGFTTYHLVSAGSTNATNIKASAGQVFGWYIYNSNAAARKVVFHNNSGTPTAGASVYFAVMIPPTSAANVFTETGMAFSSGIAITTVTGLADSDATAVAANDLIINVWYA